MYSDMREIFLSYDFGRDAHRAATVGSAWLAQGGVVHLESTKAADETEIKRWIDNRIESASATVVLVGSPTHRSRWVEYEIRQTERSGKPLLGVDVSGIRDGSGNTTTCGAKLPIGYPFYDWVADQGEKNLAEWVRHARSGLLAPQ